MATLGTSSVRILRQGIRAATAAAAPGALYNPTRRTPAALHRLRLGARLGYNPNGTHKHSMSTAIIAPWPTKMVECHGDYRDEVWLEELACNKDTTYKNQTSLPDLPVPTVEETLERFLPTALPLAESEEEATALRSAVEKFPAQAQKLQERLLERAALVQNRSSWLQHWWNTLGYLQVRDSVCINVSYYFQFSDDKTLVRSSNNSSSNNGGGSTAAPSIQIQRAASILYATGQYRNRVASGKLAPETLGRKKIPLCMTAYKYMFHACRIPLPHQDSYRIYDPHHYLHAVVARKGRFYKIPLLDASTGEVLSVETLEGHLSEIVALAASEEAEAPCWGYLTGDHRDVWATAREALLELPGMAEALEVLESGCVLINLDDASPVSRAQCGRQLLCGNGDASNRWFDKSVQLMVCPNGKAGLLGEHSMMDGMPVVGLANHIVQTTYQQARDESQSSKSKSNSSSSSGSGSGSAMETFAGVSNIFGGIEPTPKVRGMIETSRDNFREWTTGKHDLDVQSFWGYGSDYMKRSGFSPDAYVQMAMQVATTRLFGKQVGTYEASQTRVFHHGRTETTRTVSPASAAFVRSLLGGGDGGSSNQQQQQQQSQLSASDKVVLLSKACKSHAAYIGNAAKGLGVDRHFLGLSLLVRDGETAPDLYSDPLFVRSKRWRVSTSNLTHPKLDGWGYGEVVPDGVGLSYSVHRDRVIFGITARKEHGGWPERLSQYLEDALVEMKLLVDEANNGGGNAKDAAPRSKL
mmetsp:Transcript_5043/g.12379  ORF Transcript_5043/g.12379 Transcript_5043/m.12379 type:complete len:753 (-) Transcript_5043:411-2669(-)|eukprot:CAMPEP_0172391406 /NCGR_PEP_ID=MMETSP1061-20121228/7811_1 /TAXON_ID=37318 /ORGANISM="Pseudo-nitzschia pungens, Strain cf. pungens" /LENGTH=752 /DNA_ID=CAMNT_0013122019 /DNA_START=114 /DNA_END=2372 /DNA_ORIENTATION=+